MWLCYNQYDFLVDYLGKIPQLEKTLTKTTNKLKISTLAGIFVWKNYFF